MTTTERAVWHDGDPQPDDLRQAWDAQDQNWAYDEDAGRWSHRSGDGMSITIPWDDLTFGYGPIRRDQRTRLDNPPACGAPKNSPWGYLPCGCCNDGYGGHAR